jgi:hypothetical protein
MWRYVWHSVENFCLWESLFYFLTQITLWSHETFGVLLNIQNFFLIGIVGGGVQLGPLGTAATNGPIVPASGDYDDGEIGGMIGRGNGSTRRKSAPVPLCTPQTPHAARMRTRAAAVGSQRLTTWATARPTFRLTAEFQLLCILSCVCGTEIHTRSRRALCLEHTAFPSLENNSLGIIL